MSAINRLPHTAVQPDSSSRRQLPILLRILTLLAVLGLAAATYLALVYAETDSIQGPVQRVFYMHVASFAGATLAFFITVTGGIGYLRTRNSRWDSLALSGVEVGLMLSIITLVTGSIWARPIWNTWWTWDSRLTSCAVMALTYMAYLMLRSGVENPDRRRTFASVYGILAISTVIFTAVIIRVRPDTIHPVVIGASSDSAQGGFAMTSAMRAAFGANMAIWVMLITPVLIWWRYRLERRREVLEIEKHTLLEN
jgi:heme exporter protein C